MNTRILNLILRSCPNLAILSRIAAVLLGVGLTVPAWSAAPFTVNGDGTVTDETTSLVWDQCPYGLSGATCATGTAFTSTWDVALNASVAANAASYKGFSDWRVPNKNELESLATIDSYVAGEPFIDTAAFPGTPLNGFWTSTTFAPVPSRAWIVDYTNGDPYGGLKTFTKYVRLVRSGQAFASFDALAAPAPTAIPTLSEWSLLALAGLLGLVAWAGVRRQGGRSKSAAR